jgi:hypothetical protein
MWRYANSPRISVARVSQDRIQGTLDPCDATWATFAVNYPDDSGGTATAIAHFIDGRWVPMYLGDGYGLQHELPSVVYVDLFGSELTVPDVTICGQSREIEPRSITACVWLGAINEITWSSWTATAATGLGTLEIYNCPPAPSSCTKSPTFTPDYQVHLSNPKAEAFCVGVKVDTALVFTSERTGSGFGDSITPLKPPC